MKANDLDVGSAIAASTFRWGSTVVFGWSGTWMSLWKGGFVRIKGEGVSIGYFTLLI